MEADNEITGFAPVGAATPPTSAPKRDLHGGVAAFRELLSTILAIGEETVCQFGDEVDGRDYVGIALAVETSFADILSDAARREGYLRALADLLCQSADGGFPGPEWDPIQVTEGAYFRARLASNLSEDAA